MTYGTPHKTHKEKGFTEYYRKWIESKGTVPIYVVNEFKRNVEEIKNENRNYRK